MSFYENDGLCFWCPEKAVTEFFGIDLCSKHYEQEQRDFLADIGFPS